MIGIGPFSPKKTHRLRLFQTAAYPLTLRMLAILRLMFPYALIPATTALGTVHPRRQRARAKGRRKCRNAKFIPHAPAKALYPV